MPAVNLDFSFFPAVIYYGALNPCNRRGWLDSDSEFNIHTVADTAEYSSAVVGSSAHISLCIVIKLVIVFAAVHFSCAKSGAKFNTLYGRYSENRL